MRIWTIHPKYLDRLGLQGLWRESIMAKKCLNEYINGTVNKNKYINHPQLWRFKKSKNTIDNINFYLSFVYQEGVNRNYNFKLEYIEKTKNPIDKMPVTVKQVKYEIELLKYKLHNRNQFNYYDALNSNSNTLTKIIINDLFYLIDGEIEHWEKFNNHDLLKLKDMI